VEAPKTEWAQADIATDDLVPLLRGADAVIHLAWLIQPSRDDARLRAVNVEGSKRLFRAVADARVPALVYPSSVGAYSPGPKDRAEARYDHVYFHQVGPDQDGFLRFAEAELLPRLR
jgi:UDP-glucose 4-epimerase